MEEKMRMDKAAAADGGIAVASNQSRLRSFSLTKPSWLLSTLSDLDERMKMVALNIPEEDNADTFAKRAEAYYRKRPQLLALLQDLHNGYLSLADRYCQTLTKHNHHHHRQHSSQIPVVHFDEHDYCDEDENDGGVIQADSDAESSLSYQPPFLPTPTHAKLDGDVIVAELVIKSIYYDILVDELSTVERRWSESSRKIELQKSLLEVLESERLILLNENVRLGYRVTTLVEENKGLASESMFTKRKAGELARCVLKMREDRRVCMLSHKIEDLQGQIYGLEKRNKEYYEQLVKRDNQHQHKQEEEKKTKKTSKNGGGVMLEDCFQLDEEVATSTVASVMKGHEHAHGGSGGGRRVSKWWLRVKNFDLLVCGPHQNFTCC